MYLGTLTGADHNTPERCDRAPHTRAYHAKASRMPSRTKKGVQPSQSTRTSEPTMATAASHSMADGLRRRGEPAISPPHYGMHRHDHPSHLQRCDDFSVDDHAGASTHGGGHALAHC